VPVAVTWQDVTRAVDAVEVVVKDVSEGEAVMVEGPELPLMVGNHLARDEIIPSDVVYETDDKIEYRSTELLPEDNLSTDANTELNCANENAAETPRNENAAETPSNTTTIIIDNRLDTTGTNLKEESPKERKNKDYKINSKDNKLNAKTTTNNTLNQKEKKKKKPSLSTSTINRNILSGYELEKLVTSSLNDTNKCNQLFSSIRFEDFGIHGGLNKCSEPDIIFGLLFCAINFYGVNNEQWDIVVSWFEHIISLSSFHLIIALWTESQKNDIVRSLRSARQHSKFQELNLGNRLENIAVIYGLSV